MQSRGQERKLAGKLFFKQAIHTFSPTVQTVEGINKLNEVLKTAPEYEVTPGTPSPIPWSPPTSPRKRGEERPANSSGTLGTLLMLGALRKGGA